MHDVDGAVHETFAVSCVAQILRLRDDPGRQKIKQKTVWFHLGQEAQQT